jgi:type I restriction enzyme M protein
MYTFTLIQKVWNYYHTLRDDGFYKYIDLIARDKASLDNLDDLPSPDVLQQEIIDHLESALAAFRDVAAGLPKSAP